MRKPAKLSAAMQRTIEAMAAGWELKHTMRIDGSAWMTKGNEFENVHGATFHGLYTRGLIRRTVVRYPTETWVLTVAGQELASATW